METKTYSDQKTETTQEMNIDNIQDLLCGNRKLYGWMKKQYRDVCSHGDVVINHILDDAFEGILYDVLDGFDEEGFAEALRFIDIIAETYKDEYLTGKPADAFWAD